MRIKAINPKNLSAEQKPLYQNMKEGIENKFNGFKAIQEDGSLIGPWAPWIKFPKIGGPIWELTKVLSINATLPKPLREVAILVTGTKFHSGYELYAHILVAELQGLSDEKIATIVSGQRPIDLEEDEALVYDFTSSLVNGGLLPELVYKKAIDHFGEESTAELIYLIGLYCMVSITLNGFNVPIPE